MLIVWLVVLLGFCVAYLAAVWCDARLCIEKTENWEAV